MNILLHVFVNLTDFAVRIIRFIESSSILSGLAVALIISIYLNYLFRIPNFDLDVYAKTREGQGSVFLDIKNSKHLMSYGSDEVYVKIYVPEFLFDQKFDFQLSTKSGWEDWNPLHNYKDKDRMNIKGQGEKYILINAINKNDIFPEDKVTLLRVNGGFSNKQGKHTIYYQFRTRYGKSPYFVRVGPFNLFLKRFKGKQEDVEAGKLPSVELII